MLADDAGEVQAIAAEQGLIDPAKIAQETGRSLRPQPFDPSTPTSAVPGAYGVPVLVDQRLVNQPDIALATEQLGSYVKASSADLVAEHNETYLVAFTLPLSAEPTDGGAADDRSRIEASVADLTDLRMQQRLDETLHIPPLPDAARRIITLRADPDFEISALVAIIENDPSMAARIMGWANSAFYNVETPARSIADAVMRVLGFDTASSMALGLALGETLRLPKAHVQGLPPYWLEAVFTAATMEALARRMASKDRPNLGLCYLTGLLANFGTLVVGHVFPPQYQMICALQEANRHLPRTQVDEHVIKVPRELIAAALLEAWGLPTAVSESVRFQYASDYAGPNATFVRLTQVARRTLANLGLGDYPAGPVDDPTLDQLGLEPADVTEVADQVSESESQLEAVAQAYA